MKKKKSPTLILETDTLFICAISLFAVAWGERWSIRKCVNVFEVSAFRFFFFIFFRCYYYVSLFVDSHVFYIDAPTLGERNQNTLSRVSPSLFFLVRTLFFSDIFLFPSFLFIVVQSSRDSLFYCNFFFV